MTMLYELPSKYNSFAGNVFGPFTDSAGAMYIAIYKCEYPDDYHSTIYILKSSNSGSTWSEVGSQESDYGSGSGFLQVKANGQQIVMLQYFGLFNPGYVLKTSIWRMSSHSSPDSFDSVYSVAPDVVSYTYTNTRSIAILVVQQANNDFCVVYVDTNTAKTLYRTRFFKVVNGTATYDISLDGLNDSSSDYSWPINATLLQDGTTLFVYRGISHETYADIHWKVATSSYNVGSVTSGSFDITNYGISDGDGSPTILDGNQTATFTYRADKTKLYTVTPTQLVPHTVDSPGVSGNLLSRIYSTAHGDWIYVVKESSIINDSFSPMLYFKRRSLSAPWSGPTIAEYDGTYTSGSHGSIANCFVSNDKFNWIEKFQETDANSQCIHRIHQTNLFNFKSLASTKLQITAPTISNVNYTGLPYMDFDKSSWVGDDNNFSNLWEHIDDNTQNDADWINSIYSSGSPNVYCAKLTNMSTPANYNNYYVKYSYWINRDNPGVGANPTLKVRLVQADPITLRNWALSSLGASVSVPSTASGAASNIIDNNETSYHACVCLITTNQCWAKIDLGSQRNISEIYLHQNSVVGYPTKWKLEYSNDNISYAEALICTETRNHANAYTTHIMFFPRSARYWRLQVITSVDGYYGEYDTDGWTIRTVELRGLYQPNRNVIAEWVHTGVSSETSVLASQGLTTQQAQSITDWTKLYLEFEIVDG